jgi:hypothetical protein
MRTIGVPGAREAKRLKRTRYEQPMLLREFSDSRNRCFEVLGGFFLAADKGCQPN